GQRGEFLEELDRLEEEMGGAVGPLALEKHEHAAVAGELEAILGHRRSQDVAAEALQPLAVVGLHGEIGMEVEALEVGLTRPPGGDPRGIGPTPDLHDAGTSARAE